MGYPTGEQIDRIIRDQQKRDEEDRAERKRIIEEVRTFPALYGVESPRQKTKPTDLELSKVIQVAREAVLQSAGHGDVGRRAADAVEEALRRGFP
jgi:hypothetical protein